MRKAMRTRNRSFLRNSSDASAQTPSSHGRSKRWTPVTRPRFLSQRMTQPSNDDPEDTEQQTLIDSDPEDSVEISPSQSKTPFDVAEDDEHDDDAPCLVLLKLIRAALTSRIGMITILLVLTTVLASLVIAFRKSMYVNYLRAMGIPCGLYSRDGHLVVGRNTRFHVKGFSWFGMEEQGHTLGGLAKVSVNDILHFAKKHEFNAIRLPLSIANIRANPITRNDVGTFHNPDLVGVRYLDAIRTIVRKAGERFILVLLDIHRLRNKDVQSAGLWYTDDVPESQLKEAWTLLSTEFKDEWNVMGADLCNEPWNSTWSNADNDTTNWKRAAEMLGNSVHAIAPSWAIFVEGVGTRAGSVQDKTFWSENLHAMQDSPPALKQKHKTVLSPHVYGPSVFMQDYFKQSNFIDAMPMIWDDHFGEASNVTGLATVVGEWGGWLKGKDEVWQKNFFDYLMKKEIGFFYWCLNPDSVDTGGLLHDDWKTPVAAKIQLLEPAPSTKVEDVALHFQYARSWHM